MPTESGYIPLHDSYNASCWSRLTSLEKALIGLTTFLTFVVLVLIIAYSVKDCGGKNPVTPMTTTVTTLIPSDITSIISTTSKPSVTTISPSTATESPQSTMKSTATTMQSTATTLPPTATKKSWIRGSASTRKSTHSSTKSP